MNTESSSQRLGLCSKVPGPALTGRPGMIRVNRLKQPPQDRLLLWAGRLLRRRTRNVAVFAVAARLARIAWAVMAGNRPYRPHPVGLQPV